MIPFRLWFLRGSISLLLLTTGAVALAAERPPNFIVILADDLGYGDLSCYGATHIATPNLDRMAAEGIRFTDFYASANVCTPSRAGLLTGRYSVRLGLAVNVLAANSPNGIPQDEVTIAELLKPSGYRTGCIGKWHLGKASPFWPTDNGFDSFYGLPYSNDMKPLALYRGSEKIEEPVEQSTLTRRYTEEAIHFIEANKDQPFFLYIAHSMPHIPLFVTDKFKGRSKAGLYGDVVEELDAGIGDLMQALGRLGLDENTMVVFTSDNGPWFEGSAGRFRNRKGASWEGGQRVPFIARWKGKIAAGKTSAVPAMNIDLLPTIAGFAGTGLPKERTLDGRDLGQWLVGSSATDPHEALYYFMNDKISGVRSGRWKFVVQTHYRELSVNLGTQGFYAPGMLIDLESDPEENFNLSRDNPEVVTKMQALLAKGMAEIIPPAAK